MTVSTLAVAPVKGMRLRLVDGLRLDALGAVGDRDFLVVDAAGRLLLTARTPELLRIEPTWDPHDGVLSLLFPDGRTVTDTPQPGALLTTHLYDGRRLTGRIVEGQLTAALSDELGRKVRLLWRDRNVLGADDAPVTLMSQASLAALATARGAEPPDPRRFRMTITVAGADPWAELRWFGRKVALGGAVVTVAAAVPRCVVTTRDPDTGRVDARVLHTLARADAVAGVTFGVWCNVAAAGEVRRGDPVSRA